jgi:creatinine amidohydrolase/Fe(II)-dependent formamide hydrolase-like protein
VKDYLSLTCEEVSKFNREKTVFVSVVSPIETHGRHLPLGTDVFIARRVMEETCQILEKDHEVVKLFEIPLGSDAQPVFGSIWLSYGTFKRLIFEVGTHLAKMNFKHWIIFDNHGGPRHQLALAEASRKLKEKHGFNLVVPFLHIFQDMLNDSKEIGIPPGMNGDAKDLHAGTNETSLMLHTNPDLVRTKDLPRYFPSRETFLGKLLRFLKAESLAVTIDWISDQQNPYYLGDPSLADPERGRKMIEYHVKKSIELFEEAKRGMYQPPKLFNPAVRLLLKLAR